MSEVVEPNQEAIEHEISFQVSTKYEILIDGHPESSYTISEGRIEAANLPEGMESKLIESAIVTEKNYRSDMKFLGKLGGRLVGVSFAFGAVLSSAEAFRSGSNWYKAAWAAGGLVCAIFSASGLGFAEAVNRNETPETELPSKRIQALETLQQQIST